MMLLSCVAGEDSWESLRLQISPNENQLWILIWKDWYWSANTLATWCEGPTHWKGPWCWERLRTEREEGDWGWGGWAASPIQWTRSWANSQRWWGTGRPGVLQSTEFQRVQRDLVTEQQKQMARVTTQITLSQLNRLRSLKLWWDGAQKP